MIAPGTGRNPDRILNDYRPHGLDTAVCSTARCGNAGECCLVGVHAFGALAFAAGAIILSSSTVMAAAADSRCGKATWFDGSGGLTASGERAQAGALTAAHTSLPFGTEVRVENLGNGKSVVVRVNDRGSFRGSRIISVSRAAAEKLGMISDGVAKVRLSIEGEDRPAGEACGESLTVASAEGDIDESAAITETVPDVTTTPVMTTLPPVSVAISDDSTSYVQETGSEGAMIAEDAMAGRFDAAFQPESWEESELRKLIEALLPRYWRRGSNVARISQSATASAAIPWPALDGFTQVSVSRVYIADLWSTELADPASARFERADRATAVSLLTQ
jgi:rare lipoprotein A